MRVHMHHLLRVHLKRAVLLTHLRQSTCGMGTPSMILGSKCGLPLKTFHSSFRHLDVSEEQQVPR
jgi:hypothetical protein